MSGAAVLFLLNAPTLLENARKLPNEVQKTWAQYRGWVKEDAEWSGNWSSSPEGVVDMAGMSLFKGDMQITISASQGHIEGTIATKAICRSIPIFNYVMLRGFVTGDTASLVAWDIVQGERVDYAALKLKRDRDILTVTPVAGRVDWFPASARLGRDPSENGSAPSPDYEFCANEMKEFKKNMNKRSDNQAREAAGSARH